MTPGEIYDAIEGYRLGQDERQRDIITQAWLTAALIRAKRLPDLDRLLKRKGRADNRTPEERKADYEALKGRLGR